MASRELSILVTAKNLATPALSAVRGELKGIEGQSARSGAAAAAFSSRGLGGLRSAASGAAGAFGHLKGRIGELTGAAGIVGLGAGLVGVVGFLRSGVDEAKSFGDEVYKMQALTGLSAEKTSELAGAFHHYGIEAATALKLTAFAEKNVQLYGMTAKTTALFQKEYGFAVRDSAGHIKDFNTLLLDSADYFHGSASASQKAAAMAKLYGRGWMDLIPVLKDGKAALLAAEEESKALGLTLTGENIGQLAKLREATRSWGTALAGLKLQIGLAAVPAITNLANAMTHFLGTTEGGTTGTQKIVGFFKGMIAYGQQAADVIAHQVIPTFQGIYGAWLKVPKELRDLIITGLVANKTIKFMFGVSPLQLLGGIGGVLGKMAFQRGNTPVNPLFVADVTGGGGVGGLAGGAGRGLLSKLLMGIGAIAGGIVIGKEIGQAINAPVIGPAKAAEAAAFATAIKSTDLGKLHADLNAIDAQLNSSDTGTQVALIASRIPYIGDALGNVAPALERQRALLQEQIRLLEQNKPGSPASAAHFKGAAGQSAAEHALTSLTQTLKNLGFTPNMGPKARTSILEQGTRTGTDLFGEQALAVFRQAANPKAPAVLGEISRHITELRSIEKYYLDKGNVEAAAHTQRTIAAMERLIGVTSRDDAAARQAIAAATAKHVAAVQAASRASAGARARATAQMVAAGLTGSLAGARSTVAGIAPHLRNIEGAGRSTAAFTGVISRKNFNPRVNVNVNTQVALSVNSVARSLTDMYISSGRAGIGQAHGFIA